MASVSSRIVPVRIKRVACPRPTLLHLAPNLHIFIRERASEREREREKERESEREIARQRASERASVRESDRERESERARNREKERERERERARKSESERASERERETRLPGFGIRDSDFEVHLEGSDFVLAFEEHRVREVRPPLPGVYIYIYI